MAMTTQQTLTSLTGAALVTWIDANVPRGRLRRAGHRSALAAARWFCATRAAQEARGLTNNELAGYLQHPPGFNTLDDLTEALESYYLQDDATRAVALAEMQADLGAWVNGGITK